MKPRLVVLLAIVLAAAAVAGAGIRLLSSPFNPARGARCPGAETGVYILVVSHTDSTLNFSETTSFTQAAGRQPNMLGYFSGWVEPFNTSFAQVLHQHGIVPFVQIDPTDASVAAIADGTYNDYLRSYADSVRNFGHAVVIGFGHEMNAPWYSWGYNHVPASTFIAAWRHIVTLFRDQGADNVTWLWTLQADQKGTGPVSMWWPGDQYVTWVGIDGYYYVPSDTFASVFGKTIGQVRDFTSKPILLSETSVRARRQPVSQDPGSVSRAGHVQDARTCVVRQAAGGRGLSPGLAARGQHVRPAVVQAGRTPGDVS